MFNVLRSMHLNNPVFKILSHFVAQVTMLCFCCQMESSSFDIVNQPRYGASLETSQIVLLSTVLSVHTAGLAMERQRAQPQPV